MFGASQYEVGRRAVTMDCAHDQLTFGVIGSTCSAQFSSYAVNKALGSIGEGKVPGMLQPQSTDSFFKDGINVHCTIHTVTKVLHYVPGYFKFCRYHVFT